MSLALKYRPIGFSTIAGQYQVVATLISKLCTNDLPHTVLLSGPTGVGKTTLARIIANELGCTEANLTETNCADVRGIDSARDINSVMHLSPMGGKCRVWILDEVVQLPKATQQAFLKVLEDTPEHVYFLLCTSDLTGLLPTFVGRCFHLQLKALSPESLKEIINRVCDREGRKIHAELESRIAQNAEGSARKALQLLEAALAWNKHDEQMAAVSSVQLTEAHEFLGKALFGNDSWEKMAKSIIALEDKDLEDIRRASLAYASKMLAFTQQKNRALRVIQHFGQSFQWSGKAGMMAAAYLSRFATEK